MKFFSFLPFLGLAAAYSNPGACSGSCWSHDPAVIQRTSDGTYFRFNTGSGIIISTATDLEGPWTDAGYVLADGSSIDLDGNTDLWAPDVHYDDGTYYLYYAVSSFGTQESAIGVATSTTMESGSWTDHGSVGVASSTGKDYNAIDPNFVPIGDDSYLNFGSFWGDIFQVEMASGKKKSSSAASYNIEFNSTGTQPSEGSFMFEYDGYYYLLWSSGVCCNFDTSPPAEGDEYHIAMCRSSTGTGNFVDKEGNACTANGGTTLLASHGSVYGPGGQGVFTDSERGLVLYYHYADTSSSGGIGDGNYFFGWNALKWSNGWPSV